MIHSGIALLRSGIIERCDMTNNSKRCDIVTLLERVIKEDYSPNDEELKILGDLRDDIKDFVNHLDEAENKPSPFYYINMLNKLASQNFVYEGVDIARLSLLLKKIYGERYGFSPIFLDKGSEGHFVTSRETLEGSKLLPIDMSLSGYMNAFVDKVFEYHKALEKFDVSHRY